MLRHPGFSQLYFVRATFPVAIAASAWGLTILLDKVRLRELLPRMAIALAAGMLMAKILRAVTPDRPTKKDGLLLVSIQVIWPWLAVLLVAAAAALILRKTRERALALGLGVLVVFGVGSAWIPRTAVTTLTDQVCVSGPERLLLRPDEECPGALEHHVDFVRADVRMRGLRLARLQAVEVAEEVPRLERVALAHLGRIEGAQARKLHDLHDRLPCERIPERALRAGAV